MGTKITKAAKTTKHDRYLSFLVSFVIFVLKPWPVSAR